MENSDKDYASSDSSLTPSGDREEYVVPDVIITRRLRDRELLRKRKAEALEKDSAQGVLRSCKNQQQRRGSGAKRGRGHQPVVKTTLVPEQTMETQPDPQEEAVPVRSEPALLESAYQEQPAMLTIQNPTSGMQPVAVEGEPAVRSLDPEGEEKVVKPAAEEILEALNTPLENDQQDD